MDPASLFTYNEGEKAEAKGTWQWGLVVIALRKCGLSSLFFVGREVQKIFFLSSRGPFLVYMERDAFYFSLPPSSLITKGGTTNSLFIQY